MKGACCEWDFIILLIRFQVYLSLLKLTHLLLSLEFAAPLSHVSPPTITSKLCMFFFSPLFLFLKDVRLCFGTVKHNSCRILTSLPRASSVCLLADRQDGKISLNVGGNSPV